VIKSRAFCSTRGGKNESARVGAASRLGGRDRDGIGRWITEGEQDVPGFFFSITAEFFQGRLERFQAKIFFAIGALDAVEERREFNELVARIEEIQVKYLLPCHNINYGDSICRL